MPLNTGGDGAPAPAVCAGRFARRAPAVAEAAQTRAQRARGGGGGGGAQAAVLAIIALLALPAVLAVGCTTVAPQISGGTDDTGAPLGAKRRCAIGEILLSISDLGVRYLFRSGLTSPLLVRGPHYTHCHVYLLHAVYSQTLLAC